MSRTTDIKFTKGSYAISWSSLHTHRFLSSKHEIQRIKLQFYSASKVTFRPMKVWETLTHIKSMLFLPFLANYLIFMWVHVKSLQSCLTLCNPMNCSPPGSSVFRILQARILEWVAISFSTGSSWPRYRTHVSYISSNGRWVLYH